MRAEKFSPRLLRFAPCAPVIGIALGLAACNGQIGSLGGDPPGKNDDDPPVNGSGNAGSGSSNSSGAGGASGSGAGGSSTGTWTPPLTGLAGSNAGPGVGGGSVGPGAAGSAPISGTAGSGTVTGAGGAFVAPAISFACNANAA